MTKLQLDGLRKLDVLHSSTTMNTTTADYTSKSQECQPLFPCAPGWPQSYYVSQACPSLLSTLPAHQAKFFHHKHYTMYSFTETYSTP